MNNPVKSEPDTCQAPKGVACMAEEVTQPGSGLDHTDALGYSGGAFRIHTLPREVLCPSTVSPRFGYQPPKVDHRSRDTTSALRQAHKLAQAGQYGEYLSGQAAYDLWISLLEADEQSPLFREQERSHAVEDAGLPILNRYCLSALLHAREAAGPFLRRRASELSGTPSRHVARAADCYDQAVEALREIGKPTWDAAGRRREAASLRKARDLEKQAATLLGEALASLGNSAQVNKP